MTDMPQMIALYNGMGGGAAAAIAALELFKGRGACPAWSMSTLAVLGATHWCGVVFSGSLIAFGKLQGPDQALIPVPRPELCQPGRAAGFDSGGRIGVVFATGGPARRVSRNAVLRAWRCCSGRD